MEEKNPSILTTFSKGLFPVKSKSVLSAEILDYVKSGVKNASLPKIYVDAAPPTFLKFGLRHMCFLVNFEKFFSLQLC